MPLPVVHSLQLQARLLELSSWVLSRVRVKQDVESQTQDPTPFLNLRFQTPVQRHQVFQSQPTVLAKLP